jgi:hypothetical protein
MAMAMKAEKIPQGSLSLDANCSINPRSRGPGFVNYSLRSDSGSYAGAENKNPVAFRGIFSNKTLFVTNKLHKYNDKQRESYI